MEIKKAPDNSGDSRRIIVGDCDVFDIIKRAGGYFMVIGKNETTTQIAPIEGANKGCLMTVLSSEDVLLLETTLIISTQTWAEFIASWGKLSEEQIEAVVSLPRPAP